MKTVWKIFKRDVKKLFTNSMAVILAVGVAVLPSLYAWFNIYANWDPYGSTGNMQVAVVINDKGYTYKDISVNVGEEIRKNLMANDLIDWQFVSKEEALEGIKSGQYYAGIEIDEDFSESLTSIVTSEFEQPQITYYANEKKNAIATKITDKVVQTVQTEVNESFVTTVVDLLNSVLGTAVEVADAHGAELFADLQEKITDAKGNIGALTAALESFEKVMQVAQNLNGSLDTDNLTALLQNTDNLVQNTQSTIELAQASVDAVTSSADTVLSDASKSLSEAAVALEDIQDTVGDKNTAVLEKALSVCTSVQGNLQIVTDALQKVNDSLPQSLPAVQKILERLHTANDRLNTVIRELNSLLQSGKNPAADSAKELRAIAAAIQGVSDTYKADVKPVLRNEVGSLLAVMSNLSVLLQDVNGDMPTVQTLASSLEDAVGAGSSLLGALHTLLDNCCAQLDRLSETLTSLSDSEMVNAVLNFTGSNSDELGEFIACPVAVQTEKVYAIDNYGSAMAPFYTTLAIWVGAIVLVAILKTEVKNKKELGGVKPHQEYFGRLLIFLLFSLVQSLIICLGDLYFLKIQCCHPAKFIFAGCVAGLIFSFFIYSLVAAFGDIGKAIAVILLVVQLGGSGGTFPIDVTPHFFQAIHPYLPFTFVIDAMRECVCGVYANHYWMYLGMLCAYILIGLILGTGVRALVRKPVRFFSKRIEDTGLL